MIVIQVCYFPSCQKEFIQGSVNIPRAACWKCLMKLASEHNTLQEEYKRHTRSFKDWELKYNGKRFQLAS